MIYVGIIVCVIGLVLMGNAPGPAFLVLVVGLILDVIGLVRYIKKQKSKPKKKASPRPAKVEEPPKQEPKQEQKSIWLSERIGTAGLKYHYDNVPIVVTDAAPILSAAEKEEWDLSAEIINDVVHLSTVDGEIGYMERFDGMIGDWQRRKEPYRIILQNYSPDTGKAVVYLVFYKEGYDPSEEDDEWDEDDDL